MSNIHNITAESVSSIQPTKGKSTGLSRSRRDFTTRNATSVSSRPPQSQSVGALQNKITPENAKNIQQIENMLAGDIVTKALFNAGIKQNEFTMEIVNAHIKNFMPLTKENIEKVIQQSQIFKDTSFDILVMLNKAGIEVTPENIAQMEKYVMHNNQLSDNLSDIMNSYISLISSRGTNSEKAMRFASMLIEEIIPENLKTIEERANQPPKNVTSENIITDADVQEFNVLAQKMQSSQKYVLQALVANLKNILQNIEDVKNVRQATVAQQSTSSSATTMETNTSTNININMNDIGNEFNFANNNNLEQSFQNSGINGGGAYTENEVMVQDDKNLEGFRSKNESLIFEKLKEVIRETLSLKDNPNSSPIERGVEQKAIKDLLGSSLVEKLIKSEIENKWFLDLKDINPQDIKNKYNEISNDIKKVLDELNSNNNNNNNDTMLSKFNDSRISNQTLNVRDNLNFISQFNKDSIFMELPLKFREQNINGEIYVLSNKRGKRKFLTGESVNVLLKLTLEKLGELNIYVTMHNKNITSKFLTKDDKIVNLIDENIGNFKQVLNDKGYRFRHKITKDENFFDFGKDFINKNTPRIAIGTRGLNIKV